MEFWWTCSYFYTQGGFYEIYFCLNVSTTNYMKRFSQFFVDMFSSEDGCKECAINDS